MPETDGSLVSIYEASQLLGVSEAALRQWTNEGRIKSFVTPGGHRRYSKADLKKFMAVHHKLPGVKDLAVKLEDSAPLHRAISINFLQSIDWHSRLDEPAQQEFAELGRQLLYLIVRSLSGPAKQAENTADLHAVGRRYGVLMAGLGLPLVDAVQAFIQHRDPILNAVTEMLKQGDTVNRRLTSALPTVNRAMDEALVALVAAYQAVQPPESGRDEA